MSYPILGSSRRRRLFAEDDLEKLQNKRRAVEPKRHSRRPVRQIFSSVQDRFLRDDTYRESQLAVGWSEGTCIKMNQLAQEDHLLRCTPPRTWKVRTKWLSRNVHQDHKQPRHAIETTTVRWSLSFVTPKTQSCSAERDIPNLFPPRSSSHSGSRKDNVRIYWARADLMR